ncbi:MAG: hypothetical protein AB7O59_22945 [Pirellulales bacterium]
MMRPINKQRLPAAIRLLILAALVISGGCDRPAAKSAPAANDLEPSLAEQVRAIQLGHSDTIRLDHTVVRDDDLSALDEARERVRRVNLSHAEITDAGLARLCQLPQLEQLRLAAPQITDAGLAQVARLEHLRFLHLLDAPITDNGLASLHGLTQLESLYLDRTRVTDDGLARLLAALPQVHLHLDEHHHPLDPHGKEHAH